MGGEKGHKQGRGIRADGVYKYPPSRANERLARPLGLATRSLHLAWDSQEPRRADVTKASPQQDSAAQVDWAHRPCDASSLITSHHPCRARIHDCQKTQRPERAWPSRYSHSQHPRASSSPSHASPRARHTYPPWQSEPLHAQDRHQQLVLPAGVSVSHHQQQRARASPPLPRRPH